MSKKKRREKAVELSELKEQIKPNIIYNICTFCKDKHEIGNTRGEYLCPACGTTLTIK